MRRALLIFVAGCAGGQRAAPLDPATTVSVGAGAYSAVLVGGEPGPSDFGGRPVRPKVTADFTGVPVSNDWWSSLIWRFDAGGTPNPYSAPLYAHPLALKAEARGLGLGYPRDPQVSARAYVFPYRQDLLVGVEGLSAPDARVASYDDWIVTARWADAGRTLAATFGHGLPFAYFEAHGGEVAIDLADEPRVFADAGAALGVAVGGRAYGIFAPAGSRWRREGRHIGGAPAGGFFSVAALPDDRPATLARFRRHALAFVTGARVSWRYDEATAALHTTFTVETAPRGPGAEADAMPLLALYPHQWKHLAHDPGPAAYASPRGPMKLLAARSFETVTPFAGVLPVLPFPRGGRFDAGTLKSALRAAAAGDLFPPGLEGTKGTYWTGKSLVRVAQLTWLADQAGESALRDRLVAALERELEDWLDGRAPNLFAYDRTWATLIGLPSEYRSGRELNDHHFHHGQFVLAAATVARFDPAWARPERWGGMIDLLIRDCANADRNDRRFPFLRAFDPYAGHSWASGPAMFADGNNEESSSEDANFAAAVVLWGALTGRPALRDLGIFLHANLTSAIEQYWFDVDRENFPAGFARPAVGMVWGSGGRYDTWWDRNPIYVHGINFLPFTGASLYLGRHPDYVRRNYQALVDANHGTPLLWRDIVWMYLGLADPGRALAELAGSPRYEPEFGSSRAFVYHWLHALDSYGQVEAGVTADLPTFAVLRGAGTRHHVAFNPGPTAVRVHFSDGVAFDLAPFEEKVVGTPAARP